jgi:predicted metal-dependent enzyme (double-stranded beta helix superfamily)
VEGVDIHERERRRVMSNRGHLDTLVTAVRAAVARRIGWQRAGDPQTFQSHVLHSEPDGSFSVVALVWRPGQMTRVHDHVTWGAFAVIQGVEYEELFTLYEDGTCLVEGGNTVNATRDVSGFAPPGDIHRVRNAGNRTAISIHISGTDVSRLGSSVRHDYDLPVLLARAAA